MSTGDPRDARRKLLLDELGLTPLWRVRDADEADRCEPYLARQIELIRPKLIIALGKTAASNLLHTNASLSSLRGRLPQYLDIPVIVTYHPAYLLRNLPAKALVWEDLCFARSTMTTILQLEN